MARYDLDRSWRNAGFVFGAGIIAHMLASLIALHLLLRVRSRFYMALLVIVVCGMVDLIMTAFESYDTAPISVQRVSWFIISWIACCGFTFHNYLRLCSLLRGKQLRLRRPLAIVTAVPIFIYSLYTIQLLYAVSVQVLMPMGDFTDPVKTCDVWACVDALSNSIISGFFLHTLSAMSDTSSGGVELRPGYNRLLRRIKGLLIGEALLLIVPTTATIIWPLFDPLALTMFLYQGLRLLVYCHFLDNLNSMLARQVQSMSSAPTSQVKLIKNRSQVKLNNMSK